jgi:hypothetical protein
MKKYLLILTLFGTACKKEKVADTTVHCYVCDFGDGKGYRDAGCMTKDQWADLRFVDGYGVELNKKKKCQMK